MSEVRKGWNPKMDKKEKIAMKLDERGKQCPLPVIDTKKALEACGPGETVEITVDNEIAVQNLRKMAAHKGLESSFKKLGDTTFVVRIRAEGEPGTQSRGKGAENGTSQEGEPPAGQDTLCSPDSRRRKMVVLLSSNEMGQGDGELGRLLMKGFVYALTQQDILPETVLLYNSGACLSCHGSDNLEDLMALEAQGVEILTCGTCLNHYGLGEKLRVGGVTNMYEIAERITGADILVRP